MIYDRYLARNFNIVQQITLNKTLLKGFKERHHKYIVLGWYRPSLHHRFTLENTNENKDHILYRTEKKLTIYFKRLTH